MRCDGVSYVRRLSVCFGDLFDCRVGDSLPVDEGLGRMMAPVWHPSFIGFGMSF